MVVTSSWIISSEDPIVDATSTDTELCEVFYQKQSDFVVTKVEVCIVRGGVCSHGGTFFLQPLSIVKNEDFTMHDDFDDAK